ncbi:DUF6090 family protein [Hanstruepera marina]|uniref:DUF6090 family protein n=1 Tax=Hanstruepera marina TaxID=2873265 RepID=UPI001CA648D0|nr:DUF6090 family protein [Hanstruepera marina]
MIKFFRHIRQSLIEENKTSKYLKYAIGEIILVVIGILIALQINNWNNNRLEKQTEINQIKQLLEDARADSIFFESRANFIKRTDTIQKLVLSMYDSTLVDSISKLKRKKNSNLFGSRLAYQSHVMVNNSDAVDIIKNDSIERYLKRYYAKYEYVATAIELSNRMGEQYAIPLYITYSEEYKSIAQDSSMLGYKTLLKHKDIKPNIELSQRFFINALDQVTEFNIQISEFIQKLEIYLKEEGN